MVLENGENWKPSEPQLRGRHATFDSALDAAVADMLAEKSPFFDSLPDMWPKLFPGLAAMPGRYEDGRIVLYVKNSAALYIVRMKLAQPLFPGRQRRSNSGWRCIRENVLKASGAAVCFRCCGFGV